MKTTRRILALVADKIVPRFALVFCGFMFVSLTISLVGQQYRHDDTELERRVATLEELNLDHRITLLEAILNRLQDDEKSHHKDWTDYGSQFAILLLLGRAGHDVMNSRKKGDPNNEN